jgi:hypothetical protein
VLRNGENGFGSVQLFIDNDPNQHFFTFREDDAVCEQLQRIALFDLATNNADRKSGHCLRDKEGQVWAIDHGICFNSDYKLRTVIWDFAGQPIPKHMMSDLQELRTQMGAGKPLGKALCKLLEPGVRKISAAATKLIRAEVRNEAVARRDRLIALGASEDIVKGLVRLYELDGVFGLAALAAQREADELELTRSYTRLGEALALDWAQQQVARFVPTNQWERLLTAGLARDFEQLRIDFLARMRGKDPAAAVDEWIEKQRPRIDQFRKLVSRARAEGHVSAPMLAQIASQARILLAR